MNKQNYDAQMRAVIQRICAQGKKPSLLLHACCAPCSSACLERLKDCFAITVLFYNPNIEDGEYEKRKAELIRLIAETGWADIIDCDHDTKQFYSAVKGLEHCPEGGERCAACFALRLERAAAVTRDMGYDYFATTLTVSPLKDANLINQTGLSLAQKYGVEWLPTDFKKRGGYARSIELSREHSLYRQNFCGCIFSQNNS